MKKISTFLVVFLAFVLQQTNATTYPVTNLNDAGAGSLRQAILDANANPGADVIDATGVTGTITLATGEPAITDGATINGPGANLLSVSGNKFRPVFNISVGVSVNINDLAIINGRANFGYAGAGIHNDGVLDVKRCNFTGNSASDGNGGAIYNSSSCIISDCTFSGNSTLNGAGGAIYSIGNCIISGCTFLNNVANVGDGGAIRFSGGTNTVSNCTFTNNSTTGNGGAIFNYGPPTTVTNCTFMGNHANTVNQTFTGGALFLYTSGSITLQNSILAANTPGNLNAGTGGGAGNPITDGGGNLKDDNTGPATITQVTLAQLALNPIANYGGSTQTIALGGASVAIDGAINANATGLTTDQRGTGFPRISPSGGTVDVGAYEVQVVCPPGNIAYVNASATGANNGTSWTDAFTRLQDALALTSSCSGINQIWLAAGTYYPDDGGNQVNDDRNATFTLKNGLAIYGGFAGTETTLDDRNWTTNITILSGDIGVGGVATDNSFHIITLQSISNVRVDGFTVSDGFMAATDIVDVRAGAGIFMSRTSNITLDHLRIINNTALGSGPEISPGSGGGMYVERTTGATSLTNSIVQNNHAGFGGGIYSLLANSVTVSNTIFRSNSALWGGGGIVHRLGESFMVDNCLFDNNVAVSDDGQYGSGGGVQIQGGESTVFTNTVFSGNQANGLNDDGGGAMIVYGGIVGLVNCTISNNTTFSTAKADGNGICVLDGGFGIQEIDLTNTIVWGTAVAQLQNEGSVNNDHSFVKGISGSDPFFVNPADPDGADNVFGTADDGLMIASNSPAVNAGTNTGAPNDDVTGNPRSLTVADPADIGAYELPPCATPVITDVTNINSSGAIAHWNPVATAGSYITRRYITGTTNYKYAGYKKPIVDTLKKLKDLLPSTNYSVQVKSICAGGTDSSAWSAPFEFTTKAVCDPPSGLSVTNITATNATLNWSLPASATSDFQLRYRPVSAADWKGRIVPSADVSAVIKKLSAGTEYEWKIRSLCTDDTSNYVTGPNFTTASAFASGSTSTSDSRVSADLGIQVFPNPNAGNFTVRLQLPQNKASTTLLLYNNLGVKVWQLDLGTVGGNVNKNIFLENKLAAGVYVMRIQRNDARYSIKVVISN